MTTPESTGTADNPKFSAEEIGKRFLKLIGELESGNDLSEKRIEDVIGVTLQQAEIGPFYSQELGGGWSYILFFIPESSSIKKGVDLNFQKLGERFASMDAVCALSFDDYHNALQEMGFRDVPIYGEIGQLESWRYYKDDITLSIIPQNVTPGEAGRLCVKSINASN